MDTEGSRWSDYWTAERGYDGSPAYRRRGHGQPGEPLQPGGGPGSGRRALLDALEVVGRRPQEIDFLMGFTFPQGRQRILLSKNIRHIAAEMMGELIAEILQTPSLH
jgi:hypothetical protein